MNSRKPTIRAAIYARVSTLDKSQDPKTQLWPLREYAARRGFTVVAEFVDRASGRADDRLNYQALREAVRRRATDIVLVWRYDRFARSTHALITALSEFNSLGVDFISLQEGIDTTTPQGKLVFTIMAGLAEFESSLIGDRVRAGMARARAEGKHVGRAALDDTIVAQIVVLKRQGKSVSLIQHELGVSRGVVVKYAKGAEAIRGRPPLNRDCERTAKNLP
jgi:DNA invertase Pin-like site-specific DNA recombinase